MSEYVTCPICGKRYQLLLSHAKKVHNMSRDEFTTKYPNCELVSDSQRLRASSAGHSSMTKQWSDPALSAKMIDRNCKTLEIARSNPVVINKKLARLKESNSKRLTELWRSEDYRSKMSDAMKMMHDDPDSNLKKSIMEHAGRKRFTFIKSDGTELHMRSKWEVKLARWLDDNSINFEYEYRAFKYEYDNRIKIYYPDFYLPDHNIYCEVKPKAFISKLTDAKAEAVKCEGYNFMYITEDELSNLDHLKF